MLVKVRMTTAALAADLDRRRATVVFVDLLGATKLSAEAGIEPAYVIVTGCLRVLDGVARRHGGVVDRYLSDCLMAVFGFPVQSGDAPTAAIEAAVEMLEAAARYAQEVGSPLPLTLRIGINTGLMIAGDLRGSVVREFAVMGDAVNVAARLKDVGEPGAIHVGAETRAAASGRFQFAALEPLLLRGKQQLVEAYRVIPAAQSGRARPGGQPSLVDTQLMGRNEVLSELRGLWASARAGRGRTVVLTGEEGMGKSRLVAELCREASAGGDAVLVGGAVRTRATVPQHVAVDLLADRVGVGTGDDVDTIRAKLATGAADLPGIDLIRLEEVLAGAAPLSAGGAIERAFADGLGTRAARGPLLIACEDLQWADTASLDMIARVAMAMRESPIMWILTLRPEAERVARLRGTLGDGARVIALAPLDAAAATQLVDHVTGDGALTRAARDRIQARAGGNPYRLILGALLAGAVETELAQEAATVERGSEAERRHVTVLFADITGFTRMSEQLPAAEAYRAVSGCLQILHEVAVKHGGSVDKYLGDCILAMFGVPIALENAPRAALNAAIEMRLRVREYNETARLPSPLDIHVGINTGLSVAGDVSGPLLREFTLMGDAVSIASKLKDVAPAGQIWVGPGTHRATSGDFRYERAPMSADEQAAAGEAWDLRSERQRVYRARLAGGATLFAELVGRDHELATLRRVLSRLASGHGGVVGVIGEAGLGKSRLLTELAASLEGHAVRWAEGRSVAMGRTLRFHPFIDLLRSLLGGDDQVMPETYGGLETALAPLLGAEAPDLLPYLAMMIGVRLPVAVAERIAGVHVEVIDRMHVRAIRELLTAVARERPLVVFFEDLYWADRASIELLAELLGLASDTPILFLYAARPGFPETTGRIGDVAAATLTAGSVLRVDLGPLDAAATTKLLGTLFPHGTLPRASRERIAERAAGNPLYLEELLRSLIEQGAIEVTGSGLRATAAIASMVVPATMQEAILARIDYLRPRPKQILQLAAVVGQRVAEPVLADLVAEPAGLPETLDELVAAQLLLSELRGDVRYFTFKHRLIQDVTYESILETRRAELHQQVGHVIERRMQGAPGFHGMLAYHYSMGTDLVRAEEELFLAGDDAARAGAPVEALELLQESSRLYLARHPGGGDPAKRVALQKRLAGAYLHRGQMEESTRHFDEALTLLGEVSPTTRVGIGLELVKTLVPVGLDLYFRDGGASRRPPATPHDLEVIALMFDRARTQTTADPARFLLQGFATLRKLRRIDPATVPGAGMMYAGTVGIFSFGGVSFDVARRFLEVANRYADPANQVEMFFCRMMTFTHHFLSGDWDDRHEIPLAVVEDALRRGQLWDVAHHVGLEAVKHAAQGRWRETDQQIDWLEGMAQAYAYDLASVYVHACPAYLHTERRQLDAALAACDAYLGAFDEVLLNLMALGTKTKVQVLLGDLPAARATLALADALLSEGRTPPMHFGAVARSRLMLAVSEAELAGLRGLRVLMGSRRIRRDALWAAARLAWFRPEVWQAVGQLHWLAGRRRAGLQWFGRALDEAERLGMRPDAARIRLEIGRRLLDAGGSGATFRSQDPRGMLGDARRAFEQLGLSWDLARLDLVLLRVGGRALAAPVR
jgi:class 3 adenylate cyclase/predicted ATPase